MIHVRHLVTGELSILVYGNTDGSKKKNIYIYKLLDLFWPNVPISHEIDYSVSARMQEVL